MLTSRKAEVSIEFLVFVGIILVFFVFFFGIIGGKTKEINEISLYSNAQSIADKVADEINIASRFEGYYREFKIPEKLLNGDNYTIIFHDNIRMIEVAWEDSSLMSTVVTENVSGNISPGINKIRNQNGVIIVES